LKRAAAAALLIALVVSGCGKDKPSAGITAPPPVAGFSRIIGAGFTIDMPASWRQPPLDPGAFDQTAATLRAANPKLAQALELARASIGGGSRLFAIDPVDGSSVNLIVVDSGGRALAAVVDDAIGQLNRFGAKDLRQERTAFGSRDAVRLEFSLPVTAAGGTVSVPETQYYVLRGARLFILTLFGGSPNLATVAESLRIS
jgi:hypothetical protein